MTDTLLPSQIEHLGVRVITDPMLSHAREIVALHARDDEEFDQFMSMLTPEAWRCAYCDKHYATPSLARDCEARHERKSA
jgi:hypothetical protein